MGLDVLLAGTAGSAPSRRGAARMLALTHISSRQMRGAIRDEARHVSADDRLRDFDRVLIRSPNTGSPST